MTNNAHPPDLLYVTPWLVADNFLESLNWVGKINTLEQLHEEVEKGRDYSF